MRPRRRGARGALRWLGAALSLVLFLKAWDWFATPPPAQRVRRSGSAGPRVLCLHGLFASGAFWTPLTGELSTDHRLAAPDLLGFGRSPKPEDSPYDVGAHLDWLRPIVEEPGEPWVVAGHSMGTVLATHLALRWPDRVQAVLLFNAPVYASAESRRAIFGRQNLLTRATTRSKALGRVVCEGSCLIRPVMRHLGPWLRPDVPPDTARDYFEHRWHSYDRSLERLVVGRDLVPDLHRLRTPLLVVQGGADAIVEAPADIRWPPSATVVVRPGESHTGLLLDRPHEAAALVRRFLASGRDGAR